MKRESECLCVRERGGRESECVCVRERERDFHGTLRGGVVGLYPKLLVRLRHRSPMSSSPRIKFLSCDTSVAFRALLTYRFGELLSSLASRLKDDAPKVRVV